MASGSLAVVAAPSVAAEPLEVESPFEPPQAVTTSASAVSSVARPMAWKRFVVSSAPRVVRCAEP